MLDRLVVEKSRWWENKSGLCGVEGATEIETDKELEQSRSGAAV